MKAVFGEGASMKGKRFLCLTGLVTAIGLSAGARQGGYMTVEVEIKTLRKI